MAPPATAQAKLDAYGLDAVCEDIANRKSLTAIAEEQGVSVGAFFAWLEADDERSARVREVRASTARLWDEKAEEEIRAAKDDLGLRKAKELAHHYRWRATKIAPKEYGEKFEVAAKMSLEQLVGASLPATE